jgi:WW domain
MGETLRLPVKWEIRIRAASGEAYYYNKITGTSHSALPEAKSPKDLPEGWQVIVDQVTRKAYFVEHSSKKSYWRLPDSLVSSWRSNDSTLSSISGLSESNRLASPYHPPPFDAKQDCPRHIIIEAVAQTVPEANSVPANVAPVLIESAPSTPSFKSNSHLHWERMIGDSGNVYYVDHANKRCQREVPEGFVDPEANVIASACVGALPPATATPSRAQPSLWERRVDPQTGTQYFIDHANQISQWHAPPGFEEPTTAAGPPPVHAQPRENSKSKWRWSRKS